MKKLFFRVLLGVCFSLGFFTQVEAGGLEKIQLIVSLNEESPLSHETVGIIHRNKIEIRDKFSGDVIDYYGDNPDLSGVAEVEIVIKDGAMEKSIAWPYMDLNNLVNFFRGRKVSNCAGFVNMIKGKEVADFRLPESDWIPIESNSPGVGDVVALSEEKNCSKAGHYAIYLSDDLYFSKYGAVEKPIIATMEEMQSKFRSKCVLVYRGLP